MSVMSFESTAGGRDIWRAVTAMVGSFVGELKGQRKARRDRLHLDMLPDYLLRDIGISRLEIDRIGRWDDRAAFRRRA